MPLVSVVFLSTVGIVALMFVAAARHVRVAGVPGWLFAILTLLVTLLVPALLAREGLLDRYDPLPAPALLIVAAILIATVVVALSPAGGRLASSVSVGALVLYQAFRIPVEWVLHQLYLDNVVPVQMTYAGQNYDIVTGTTALLLGLFIATGRRPRWLVILWNLMGLGLLANIVTIAVVSTPVPFRVFMNDPPNLLPSTFPYVWLPTFLVPAALFGHLLVFRALGAREWR